MGFPACDEGTGGMRWPWVVHVVVVVVVVPFWPDLIYRLNIHFKTWRISWKQRKSAPGWLKELYRGHNIWFLVKIWKLKSLTITKRVQKIATDFLSTDFAIIFSSSCCCSTPRLFKISKNTWFWWTALFVVKMCQKTQNKCPKKWEKSACGQR